MAKVSPKPKFWMTRPRFKPQELRNWSFADQRTIWVGFGPPDYAAGVYTDIDPTGERSLVQKVCRESDMLWAFIGFGLPDLMPGEMIELAWNGERACLVPLF